MDIQTKDGILLRGIPDGTPDEVIKERIAKIRAEGGGTPTIPTAPQGKRLEPVELSTSDKLLAKLPDVPQYMQDVATGMTNTYRGALNLAGRPFQSTNLSDLVAPNAKTGLGDTLMPAARGSEGSVGKTVGELLDPVAWAVGSGIPAAGAKAAAAASAASPALAKALQATPAFVGRAASGAAMGGTLGALSDDAQKHGGAATGALTGAGVGAATNVVLPPVLSGLANFTGKAWDILSGNYGVQNARKIAIAAANGDKGAIETALNAASGQPLTAAQAAAPVKSDTWNALGEFARSKEKNSFTSRLLDQQEADRLAALGSVKPNLANALAERDIAASPLYQQARAAGDVVNSQPIVGKIDTLLEQNSGNPEMVTALNKIRNGLLDKDVPIANAQKVSSVLDGLKTAIANKDNKFILGTLNELKGDLSKAIPGYEAAQGVYAAKSIPVNQSQVLEAMANELKKPTGGERVTPFLNVLGKGEQALLKRSTGYPRYEAGDLPNLMSPQQMGVINDIARALRRDAAMKESASAGMGGLQRIMEDNYSKFYLPNWISAKVAIANRGLREAETRINEKALNTIVDSMQTPQGALDLMNRLSTSEKLKLLEALHPGMVAGGTEAFMPR